MSKSTLRLADWLARDRDLPIELTAVIERETDKAVHVTVDGRQIWLPKSYVKIVEPELSTASQIDEALPLYPYQKVGVEFLVNRRGALLADDMGLGKTIQVLAACDALGTKKHLIICPNSLKYVWKAEIEKWLVRSSPNVTIIEGWKEDRLKLIESVRKSKTTTYAIINKEAVRLHTEDLSLAWDVIVVDEATALKNRYAQVTKSARAISRYADRIYLVTGTPILNHVEELWSLLNILQPKEYRSYWKFVERYCNVTSNGFGWVVESPTNSNDSRLIELRQKLSAIYIRRLKSEVWEDMPAKTVQVRWVDLDPVSRRVYDDLKKQMLATLETGEEIEVPAVLALIMRLKQSAVDPYLMLEETDKPIEGAKIDALEDLLEEINGQKLVVFTQFARAARRLAARLKSEGRSVVLMTGETSTEDRAAGIKRFQEDSTVQVFIASTQSGGVGITLTAAAVACFLDKGWTPATNTQAQDRLHRIGQKFPVTIIEILARDTIELRIEQKLREKTQLIDAIIKPTSGRELLRSLVD